MTHHLTYAVILLAVVGVAAPSWADEMLKKYDGQRIGKTATRVGARANDHHADRSWAPNPVETRREIIIDRRGRRIGLAIPDLQGQTDHNLLRLRSGKRVGNQIFDAGGRRVGIIISK